MTGYIHVQREGKERRKEYREKKAVSYLVGITIEMPKEHLYKMKKSLYFRIRYDVYLPSPIRIGIST